MFRSTSWLLFFCLCLAVASAHGDESGQSGLTTMWQSQVKIDASRDTISEVHLHVHDDQATSYYEIRFQGFRETIGFDDLNPRGIPFRDVDPSDPARGAREWAQLKEEIYRAEGRQDITVELITVPRTTIYALTGIGVVHAIDAETGQTLWTVRLGNPNEPTVGLAANNRCVIAVRGSMVYCLNAEDGNEIWSHYTTYVPGGGVSMSDDFAYVTSLNGRLQMYPLDDDGVPESFFASTGAATFDPAVTSSTVSWATERGFFNVARSNVVSLRYRLETNDRFESPGAAVGDFLIANSVNGKVYAVAEEEGVLVWEFAVGERLAKKPIPIGNNAVMLITASDRLLTLDTRTGSILEGWPKRIPGITEYVGSSQNVLYFLDTTGNLVGLNRSSGSTVSRTSVGLNVIPIPNLVTDRLYLARPNGSILGMREIANLNPVVLGEDFQVLGVDASASPGTKDPQTPPAADQKMADPNDPFGGAAQPGAAQPGDDKKKVDPDDPFAGGKKSNPDDPFAGGNKGDKSDDKSSDDPFAGGGKSGDDKSGDGKSDDDDPFDG